MKTTPMQNVFAAALVGLLALTSAHARDFSSEELNRRTLERRAVDAVIWGLPLVSEDAVKQAAFRDGKANYNDIVWWPKGGGWKNQSPTPNVNTRYMYFFINTKQDGPVVVELPPAVPGASFYGTIEDAWYVPLVDIGFEGKGGKYLVLPPDYKGDVPNGYIPVRPTTYNTMTLLRSILASLSEKDVQAGNDLVKRVKVYPLSKAANPPAQRLLDMSDVMYNGLVKYDANFFTSLARVLNEETVQPRDLEMMGMLLPLGIEKGKEFNPDAATVALLKSAANGSARMANGQGGDGHYSVVAGQPVVSSPARPLPCRPDSSGRCRIILAWIRAPSLCLSISAQRPKLGTGSFYFGTFHDHSGNPLEGGNNYRLHVPADVPVREFWSVTVYSLETSSFFLNSTRLTLGSLDKDCRRTPMARWTSTLARSRPPGEESNWLYTQPGQKWFPWFRVYGPEKAIFDKSLEVARHRKGKITRVGTEL